MEDQTLQEFYNELGPKWTKISKKMKAKGYHRNSRQCKGRMKVLFDWARAGA
ncbi:MAG: myb/SANT-like DNA-binding domain-containing protein [Puniceicoccales bacterium]|nr:myb/SANT-like DNA-binding domain-containing protein [Puniceicoccales bacterium]